MRVLPALGLSLALAGCASLSERDCRSGDWYRIGVADGSSGDASTRIDAHREACRPYAIEPDAEQYEAGRLDGLVHYCTVSRGFDVGRAGLQYSGACPPGRESDFLRGYELGRRYYTIDDRLAGIERDLRAYRHRLADDELDEEQRRRLARVVRDLETERWRLESERRELDWDSRRL